MMGRVSAPAIRGAEFKALAQRWSNRISRAWRHANQPRQLESDEPVRARALRTD